MNNILQLIPFVVQTVKTVETLLPAGSGKDKLDAAIAIIENVYGALNEALPSITSLVAVIVTGLNAVGLFKRKTA